MLKRELTSLQATAINMIDMVGIGPFVTTALVMSTMGSVQGALLAWTIGMLIAFVDACVWSELGAKLPHAGGTYAFLRSAYGEHTWGRLMAFLFVWQTAFQAPLVVTSGALGFAKYASYFYGEMSALQSKLLAAGVIVVLVALLYRRIGEVGKISVVLWCGVVTTLLWIIISGIWVALQPDIVAGPTTLVPAPLPSTEMPITWSLLGAALLPTIYSYLGYYNVCHLGAEVAQPEKVIPRSMFVSILGIGALYLAMQWSISSVLSVQTIANSGFVVSTFINVVWGSAAAQVVTVLVLVVAISSLFSVILGYTRIPYAAAKDGLFFQIFALEHPTKSFPHASLLILGAVAVVFSLTLTLGDSIKAIITMRVFTQFIAQSVGLVLFRRRVGAAAMPWKMWLYPIPLMATIAAWLWIFSSAESMKQIVGLIAPVIGVAVYLALAKARKDWPFLQNTEVA